VGSMWRAKEVGTDSSPDEIHPEDKPPTSPKSARSAQPCGWGTGPRRLPDARTEGKDLAEGAVINDQNRRGVDSRFNWQNRTENSTPRALGRGGSAAVGDAHSAGGAGGRGAASTRRTDGRAITWNGGEFGQPGSTRQKSAGKVLGRGTCAVQPQVVITPAGRGEGRQGRAYRTAGRRRDVERT